jgi:aryl-alcohol dehydrogenase
MDRSIWTGVSSAMGEQPMRVTAAVVREQGSPFVIEEVDLEEPRSDDVLVRIVGAGVCHTDLHVRDRQPRTRPAVLGHEGAGVVERVGGLAVSPVTVCAP